jgi:type I restriction enzyme S subunit
VSASTQKMRLDELGKIARGKSRHRPRNDPALYGGCYPFFQTGDIKAANLYLRRADQTYNELGLAQSRLWPPGTLCITIAANIAETAFLAVDGCFPDSVVGFIADPIKADARFVKYSLDTMKAGMQNVSRGTTQDNLSVEKLLSFKLMVPALGIQHRIAGILSAYDDLIDVNSRRIAILEEMARRFFEEWFVRFKFPGCDPAEHCTSNGQLPQGWSSGRLSDIVSLRKMPAKPGDHLASRLYVPIECISRKTLFLEEALDYTQAQSSLQLFDRNDILFGAMRAYFHKVTVAPFDGITRSTCFVLRPSNPSYWSYATFLLFHEATVAYAATHSKGATIPYASWDGSLAAMPVVIPPIAIAKTFGAFIDPVVQNIQSMFFTQRALRAARDLLLPRLISGEIDLSRAEVDLETVAKRAAAE